MNDDKYQTTRNLDLNSEKLNFINVVVLMNTWLTHLDFILRRLKICHSHFPIISWSQYVTFSCVDQSYLAMARRSPSL
jgi:hypothetical protein